MKFSSSQRNPFEADFSISSTKCLPALQFQQTFQLYFEFVLMKSVEFHWNSVQTYIYIYIYIYIYRRVVLIMRHYCFNHALFSNLLLGYDCCLIELRLISFEFRSIVLQLWRACLGRFTHLARLTMSSYSSMEHLTVRREITGCTHYVTFTTIFLVHVAQWLEHLTGHQKVTGCTHM